MAEVAGFTFSDSNSAPVPKFLNPGPEIFQICESGSCSDSGYHQFNRNLSIFFLRNDHADSCYCRNGKMTPGPKEKRGILPESTPTLRIRGPLW